VRRGRSRAVGSTDSRVVLRSTPAETDTRVSDRITLHLVDGHLGGVAMDKLDETAALARRYLDIGDLTKALEERSQLVLGDVAGKTTNEDSGVVGISELVHLSGRVETTTVATEALHTTSVPHLLLRHAAHHRTAMLRALAGESVVTAVLGSSGRNAHRSVTTVNALHLNESALLVVLVREANETVAAALARHGVGHDLCRLARGETALEERDQDVLVDLRTKVADEDAVLGATIVPAVNKTTTGCPVELERASAVRNRASVHTKGLVGSLGSLELDEAVAGITGVLVADDLDVNTFVSRGHEHPLNEVLIHPGFELSHPKGVLLAVRANTRGGRDGSHVRSRGSAVLERHWARRGAVVGGNARENRVHFHDALECSTGSEEKGEEQDVTKLIKQSNVKRRRVLNSYTS
jgi:hypothetical protein